MVKCGEVNGSDWDIGDEKWISGYKTEGNQSVEQEKVVSLFNKQELQIVTPTLCPWIYFVRPLDFILALGWNDYLAFIWNIQQINNIFNSVHQLFIKYLIPIQYRFFLMTGNHKCPAHKENKLVCYMEAHFCLVNKFYS